MPATVKQSKSSKKMQVKRRKNLITAYYRPATTARGRNVNCASRVVSKYRFTHAINTLKIQIHPNLSIAQPALETLNDLIADIFKRICKETEFLMMESDKKTMELRDIHYGTRLLFQPIPFTWDDCKKHITGNMRSYYRSYDDLISAVKADMIINGNSKPTTANITELRNLQDQHKKGAEEYEKIRRFLYKHSQV